MIATKGGLRMSDDGLVRDSRPGMVAGGASRRACGRSRSTTSTPTRSTGPTLRVTFAETVDRARATRRRGKDPARRRLELRRCPDRGVRAHAAGGDAPAALPPLPARDRGARSFPTAASTTSACSSTAPSHTASSPAPSTRSTTFDARRLAQPKPSLSRVRTSAATSRPCAGLKRLAANEHEFVRSVSSPSRGRRQPGRPRGDRRCPTSQPHPGGRGRARGCHSGAGTSPGSTASWPAPSACRADSASPEAV